MAVIVKKTMHNLLREGDLVTVAVTHEVKIGRESAWIKYEARSNMQPGENDEDVKLRLAGHVTKAVVDVAEMAAEEVLNK